MSATAPGPLSFRRIVDIPFEACVAALDRWQRTGRDGELRLGESQLLGPMERDRDSGTRRLEVRLARGPLRPILRMRLDIDWWSSSSTALELIPCRSIRPTAAYFRAGHLLLDSLTRSLPQHLPPAQARDTASPAHVPVGSGRRLSRGRRGRGRHSAVTPHPDFRRGQGHHRARMTGNDVMAGVTQVFRLRRRRRPVIRTGWRKLRPAAAVTRQIASATAPALAASAVTHRYARVNANRCSYVCQGVLLPYRKLADRGFAGMRTRRGWAARCGRAGSYQVTWPARRGEGSRGGRQIGSGPARGAAAGMWARPSREAAGQALSPWWR